MKIDSTSQISSTLADQVSNKQSEEKLKSFSDTLDKAKENGDADELKKVAQQFEAFFLNEIFKSMRTSSSWGEGLTEKSHARSTYESMHDQTLSDDISEGRGIGISDMIFKQMSKSYGIGTESAQNTAELDDKKNDKEADTSGLDIKG